MNTSNGTPKPHSAEDDTGQQEHQRADTDIEPGGGRSAAAQSTGGEPSEISDEPYSKSYEENPLNPDELLKAAESVPIRDYSDYEIAIEAKTQYSDALFDSETDLEQALEQPLKQSPEQPGNPQHDPAASEPQSTAGGAETGGKESNDESTGSLSTAFAAAKSYDFSPFLSMGANGAIPAPSEEKSPTTPIVAINRSTTNHALTSTAAPAPDQTLIEKPLDDAPVTTEASPSPEPKGLAAKLKQKAKQQFDKSKAHFDEYLGRSLPERELPLDFAFPVQKSKKEFDQVASGYSIRKLFDDKGKSILSLFRQANHDLTQINKCSMLASSRHSLLDTYAEPLVEKAGEVIHSFERKPNLTGDSKRLNLADHCESAFRQLINGYKQVYCNYYEAANVVYGPQRGAANAVLTRLINLLLVEAKLYFALHRAVPAGSIKAMNKLFTVARLYEPQLVSAPCPSLLDGETTSIKAMYYHFQVLLVLDCRNLSSLLYRVIHPYLRDKLALLSLRDTDSAIESTQRWIITHEHSGAPRLNAIAGNGDDAFAPTVVDVTRFFQAIKRDYAEYLQHIDKPAWKSDNPYLAAIKPHFSITLLAALNRLINQHEQSRPWPVYSIYQPVKMLSFSGLEAIFSHLNFSYALATKKPERKGEAVADLPAKPKPDKTQWRRAREEPDVSYMQLDEAESVAQLDNGQPVLLIEIEENEEGGEPHPHHNGKEIPTLCLIERSERLQGNKLNLSVVKLGEELTQATLTTAEQADKPVLLAIGSDDLLLITDYDIKASAVRGTLTLPDGSTRDIGSARPLWMTQRCQVLAVN